MIGYVTLGTNDLKKAGAFYDKIAGELGAERFMEADNFIAWGRPDGGGSLIGIHRPFDGKPATVGNGVMVALAAKDKAQVDRIYNWRGLSVAPMKAPPATAAKSSTPLIFVISTATS